MSPADIKQTWAETCTVEKFGFKVDGPQYHMTNT